MQMISQIQDFHSLSYSVVVRLQKMGTEKKINYKLVRGETYCNVVGSRKTGWAYLTLHFELWRLESDGVPES